MKYNALIFDFDGTIADTLEESIKIYNILAEKYALNPVLAEELPELRHLSLGQLLDHLGISKHRLPKILFQATRMLKKNISTLPLISGMAEVLPELRKHTEHFGILTSNSVENVNLFLKTHALENVFTFVSSTSKLTGKARHLRNIQKTYRIEKEKALYIGDEIRDIHASKKAGFPIAAVAWGFNSPESLESEHPDFMLQHPRDLFALVPEIASSSPTS